jgi:hypothetical protein
VAFFFLGIMLSLTFADYLSRGWFTASRGSTSAGAIVNLSGPLTTGNAPLEPAGSEHLAEIAPEPVAPALER